MSWCWHAVGITFYAVAGSRKKLLAPVRCVALITYLLTRQRSGSQCQVTEWLSTPTLCHRHAQVWWLCKIATYCAFAKWIFRKMLIFCGLKIAWYSVRKCQILSDTLSVGPTTGCYRTDCIFLTLSMSVCANLLFFIVLRGLASAVNCSVMPRLSEYVFVWEYETGLLYDV